MEYVGDVATDRTTCGEKLEVWDCCRRWASDGGMMCIYNCIFVIICMTFYDDDDVYYVCDT